MFEKNQVICTRHLDAEGYSILEDDFLYLILCDREGWWELKDVWIMLLCWIFYVDFMTCFLLSTQLEWLFI